MLKLAVIFFVISVIAGFLGLTSLAAGARFVAKLLFAIALVVVLAVVVAAIMLGRALF